MHKLVKKYELNKIVEVVCGGETGQDSIYHGLSAAARHYPADSIVLIHDGVRPLIDEGTIIENIALVKKTGSCITCVPAVETFVVSQQDGSLFIPSRADSLIARAPQSFILKDILEAHESAPDRRKARLYRLLYHDELLWSQTVHYHRAYGEY